MAARKPSQLELVFEDASQLLAGRCQFKLDGRLVSYTLKRSRRRYATSFTIDERGLRVAAPWAASQLRIDSLLLEHAAWISRKLAQWEARRPPPLIWQPGALIRVVGEPVQLVLATVSSATQRHGDRLCIATDSTEPAAIARHTIDWLRTTALAWFELRAMEYTTKLGVRMPVIRLSNARTRWGYCYPEGRIHLNWRLIQTPSKLIDYVVVHELAHLREPNHSRRFWRWVAGVLPDYEQRRRALRCEAHRYLLV